MQTQTISRMHTTVDGGMSQSGCCSDTECSTGFRRLQRLCCSRQSIPAPESLQSNNSGNTKQLENKNYGIKDACACSHCGHLHPFLPLSILLIVNLCNGKICANCEPRVFPPSAAVAGVAFA